MHAVEKHIVECRPLLGALPLSPTLETENMIFETVPWLRRRSGKRPMETSKSGAETMKRRSGKRGERNEAENGRDDHPELAALLHADAAAAAGDTFRHRLNGHLA